VLIDGAAFEGEAERYDALVSREDFKGNIASLLQEILPPGAVDICDLGTGTGRLAGLLAGRARSMCALDRSHQMLTLARRTLRARLGDRSLLVSVADNRCVPLATGSCDVLTSGWSVSYLAVWNPATWRAELDRWLVEALRVVRPGGTVVVIESLGTGNEAPIRLEHLENVYAWLDEQGFRETWIRTDYQFHSVEEAAALIGHYFGEDLKKRVQREHLQRFPECTGVWWKSAG